MANGTERGKENRRGTAAANGDAREALGKEKGGSAGQKARDSGDRRRPSLRVASVGKIGRQILL